MHIHFNHHISCLSDIILMIREAHPNVTMSASHTRKDHGLSDVLETVTKEMMNPKSSDMPKGYVSWLINSAKEEGADVVIPYLYRHELSLHAGAFDRSGLTLITCGTHEIMTQIEDKTSLLRRAEKLGILISPFFSWNDVSGFNRSVDHYIDTQPEDVRLCVKPSQGIYGEGFRILYDELGKGSFRTAMRDQDPTMSIQSMRRLLKQSDPGKKMMTMPFLPGLERSVDFACLNGRMLGAVTREKHGNIQIINHNSEAVEMASVLVADMSLSGLANIQTLEGSNGYQHLLEMNSRAAGGIGMTAHSGINLPGLLVSGLQGKFNKSPAFPKRQKRVMRRTVYELI
jgi:hypothetical protein